MDAATLLAGKLAKRFAKALNTDWRLLLP